jgi:hypothetical protein
MELQNKAIQDQHNNLGITLPGLKCFKHRNYEEYKKIDKYKIYDTLLLTFFITDQFHVFVSGFYTFCTE